MRPYKTGIPKKCNIHKQLKLGKLLEDIKTGEEDKNRTDHLKQMDTN
jgi:hypothetical protein